MVIISVLTHSMNYNVWVYTTASNIWSLLQMYTDGLWWFQYGVSHEWILHLWIFWIPLLSSGHTGDVLCCILVIQHCNFMKWWIIIHLLHIMLKYVRKQPLLYHEIDGSTRHLQDPICIRYRWKKNPLDWKCSTYIKAWVMFSWWSVLGQCVFEKGVLSILLMDLCLFAGWQGLWWTTWSSREQRTQSA